MRLVLALVTCVVPAVALADFTGRVVHVQDGDTLTVLVAQREIRVRLESIDAPELKQPFGNRSKQSLVELCGTKSARVIETGKDRYRRVLGWVLCDGVDASREQVRRGMAWVFVRYAAPNSPLYQEERRARAVRSGLWADRRPVAPWKWRARQAPQQ